MLLNSKNNMKELGKDLKGFFTSAVCIVKDTLNIPIALCKDGRDTYLERKANKNKKSEEVTEDKPKRGRPKKIVEPNVQTA